MIAGAAILMFRISGVAAILLLVTGLAVEGTGPARGEVVLGGYIDEAPSDPAFEAFRARLLAAVRARDTEAVLALSSPDILASYGGHEGHDGFRSLLDPDPADMAPEYAARIDEMREGYWLELEEVVAGGGAFDDDGYFLAPWSWVWEQRLDEVRAADGLGDMDITEQAWVAADAVAVHAAADANSAVIATLGRGRVRVLADTVNEASADWARIELPDGRTGLIRREGYRHGIDFRAIFEQNDKGEWKMIVFVAGD